MLSPHAKYLPSHLICFFSVLHRFEKKVPLVFMGGSITPMDGYITMLKNFWNKYFPLYPFTYGFAGKSNFQIVGKMKDGVSLFQK